MQPPAPLPMPPKRNGDTRTRLDRINDWVESNVDDYPEFTRRELFTMAAYPGSENTRRWIIRRSQERYCKIHQQPKPIRWWHRLIKWIRTEAQPSGC